jgi:hypothetical protein
MRAVLSKYPNNISIKMVGMGQFDGWLRNNEFGVIFCCRVSIASAACYACNRYDDTVSVQEVFNSGGFKETHNNQGTISITYNTGAMGVYSIGIKNST